MAYLIDTDVISATRQNSRDAKLEAWLRSLHHGESFISAISIGEIEKGIEKQRRINPKFASDLSQWLDNMLLFYSNRILPVDTTIARRWGIFSQLIGHCNADILIAATAIEHGLVISTRNTRHFESTGVEVINPFI